LRAVYPPGVEEERRVRGRLIEPGVLRVEVDGVPLFWAEGHHQEAEAGLLFRVGRADETLPTAGISRLTAAAAAAAAGPGVPVQVDVGPCTTGVRCRGSVSEVTEFLSMFSSLVGAGAQPVLEVRERLRTEGAPISPASVALGLRYGARGPGLLRHEEYGLGWLGSADVAAWGERWFNAANGAGWMIAPRLQGMGLLLPEGARALAAPLPVPRTPVPAAVLTNDPDATVAFVSEASLALRAALDVVGRLGRVECTTLNADTVHAALTLGRAETLTELVPQLEAAVPFDAVGAISSDDLLSWCEHELLGTAVLPRAYRLAAHQAITGREMASAWQRGLDNAVYLLPRRASTPGGPLAPTAGTLLAPAAGTLLAPAAGTLLAPAAAWCPPPHSGTVHRATEFDVAHPSRHVVVEPDAVVLVIDESHAVRARLTGATLLRLADGSRGLWSTDGVYLELHPADWEAGEQLIEAVERSVPTESIVPLANQGPGQRGVSDAGAD